MFQNKFVASLMSEWWSWAKSFCSGGDPGGQCGQGHERDGNTHPGVVAEGDGYTAGRGLLDHDEVGDAPDRNQVPYMSDVQ
jgi:hypothetical protein